MQAQETSLDVPVVVNTSTSSVQSQRFEERISSSVNDIFVIMPPHSILPNIEQMPKTVNYPSSPLQIPAPLPEMIDLEN